jgi:hypothetical protein
MRKSKSKSRSKNIEVVLANEMKTSTFKKRFNNFKNSTAGKAIIGTGASLLTLMLVYAFYIRNKQRSKEDETLTKIKLTGKSVTKDAVENVDKMLKDQANKLDKMVKDQVDKLERNKKDIAQELGKDLVTGVYKGARVIAAGNDEHGRGRVHRLSKYFDDKEGKGPMHRWTGQRWGYVNRSKKRRRKTKTRKRKK